MKLCLPKDILKQHIIVLGKTGAGKSSALRHLVENLLNEKRRVCIVDPKGDWYGLKFSADGKSAGYGDVICFGDFKEQKASDVPINAHSGKQIAELIASGNRPCVIGFRGWMPSALARFWIDFSSTLFNSNANSGLTLVISEVQNFAPKERLAGGDENLALHWTKRLMLEGRGIGIVMLMDSQRPQNVHNTILTQCETLVAMRVIHESDRAATETWIKGAGDKVKGAEVLNSLAGMERGEAWVWSPEIGFGPQRVKFPMFETFDSFAPPQQQKKISGADWSTVDLDDVKLKLANVIEEAKAKDPVMMRAALSKAEKELAKLKLDLSRNLEMKAKPSPLKPSNDPLLKTQIKQLKSALEAAMKIILEVTTRNFDASVPPEQIEKAVTSAGEAIKRIVREKLDAQSSEFARLKTKANAVLAEMKTLLEKNVTVKLDVAHNEPFTVSSPKPVRTFSRPIPSETNNGNLQKGPARVLTCLIQFPNGVDGNQITVLTGYTRRTRDSYVQILRELGYSDRAGELHIATEAGREALPDAAPLPTGEALQNYWLQKLPLGERRCFEALLAVYPNSISKDAVSEQTGYTRRTRDSYLQALRAKELFTEPTRGEVRAADQLFQ